MHWLVDGYNVIRREPALAEREREGLEAGRQALCRLLSNAARVSGDRFTVVFDGSREGGSFAGGPGVHAIFSSARETADHVLARMATAGAAVVSNDREVRRAAARARDIAITADEFLSRLERGAACAVRTRTTRKRAGPSPRRATRAVEQEGPPRGPRAGPPCEMSEGTLRPGR
jgi:predicted RNA-binding protein with PIN domain